MRDREKSESAFLGLERRRDCEGMLYGAFFGEVFAIFGVFFAKSGSFYSTIEGNGGFFDTFEKGAVVFALSQRLNHKGYAEGLPGRKE